MIGYVSPKRAYSRAEWRNGLNQLERNFNSAKLSRLPANFRPVVGDAETVNRGARDALRAIARNLENNSDIAESIANAFERNVIGSGFTLQIKTDDEKLNNKIETLFKQWCKPGNCEVTEGFSFLDVQNIIMRRIVYDGGIIIKKVTDKNAFIPFKLQLLEVDELDKSAQIKTNNTRCFDGVEVDLQNKPLKYHIKKYDTLGISTSSESIDAKNVIYLRRLKRPSQIREVSEIARTSERISNTDEYLTSVGIKERVAACFAAFITKQTPGSNAGFGRSGSVKTSESGAPLKNITPGMIQYLKTGEDAKVVAPNGQASDTEKYVRTEQRLLSSGMGLSYETVARDLSQVNYSSARQNLLEDKETYKFWQRFLIDHFCEVIFDEFIKAIILKGYINFNQDILHEWVSRGWNWIDPLKEAKADETALNNNLSTLQRLCAEKGLDWKEVLSQRQKEKLYMQEIGLIPCVDDDVDVDENAVDNKTGKTEDETIAKVSLNGAQIQGLLLIVTSVVDSKLDYDAAVELITQAFPFSEETAKIILGDPDKLNGKENPKNEDEEENEENATEE